MSLSINNKFSRHQFYFKLLSAERITLNIKFEFFGINKIIIVNFFLHSIKTLKVKFVLTQVDKMERFSPKIEIINHFDKLINRVDIDFEESLEKYNTQQVIGKLEISDWEQALFYMQPCNFDIDFVKTVGDTSSRQQAVELWSESTKVIDYLKQIQISSIQELRKAQEDSLEYYKLNSSRIKSELNLENKEQLKSQLFADKFYFQVYFTQTKIMCFQSIHVRH